MKPKRPTTRPKTSPRIVPAKPGPAEHSAPVSLARTDLFADVRNLILHAREAVTQAVDAALTMLHWHVGQRIREDILNNDRAEYGKEIVSSLGKGLSDEFGRGFNEKSLRHMVKFAEAFSDPQIVSSLMRQLSWTHLLSLIYIADPLKRDFYAEMCRIERWSTRLLRQKIDSMLYERTALSKKPDQLIRKELDALRTADRLTPDLVFQDPYLLDFLGLHDTYCEKDLESALLREIERFLLELGSGFAFIERQKRITLDGDDYYMDLLFFHRRLRRLIVIELKLSDFRPADAGQVELYLRWLDRHERQPGEEPPLAIILCSGKKRETVEYLDLGRSGIHVAEYLTELPPREVLRERFQKALAIARARIDQRSTLDGGQNR